jgi:Uma2 family endonuclease
MITASSAVRKHLTDVHEWQRLGEANIFAPNTRVELIEGEILEMPPIGSYHAGHLKRLTKLFSRFLNEQAIMSVQDPLRLSDLSEPQPDFMLLRPDSNDYTTRHPTAEDVLLLIEVAESSLSYDQNEKMHFYAHYNIAEYWLLNLKDYCLEVYREPHNDLYQQKMTLRKGDTITLSQLKSLTINISDILSG